MRLENLTPKQEKNTTEQVRQVNETDNINQPVQQKERFEDNETFVVENKKALEKIKTEVLEEFFKIQNMIIEDQEPLLKLETRKIKKSTSRLII